MATLPVTRELEAVKIDEPSVLLPSPKEEFSLPVALDTVKAILPPVGLTTPYPKASVAVPLEPMIVRGASPDEIVL
jgi:hypothetical protein